MKTRCMLMTLLVTLSTSLFAADLTQGMKPGAASIESAGPIAFAPNGILLAADPKNAAIIAISTGDLSPMESKEYSIENLDQKVAAALGTTASEIRIVDIATNPASHAVYVSVSRGLGPDAGAILLRVMPSGEFTEVDLAKLPGSSVALPNAPESKEGGRRGNPRHESITDLAFSDGRVVVAGLSNEEFASNLRSIAFPFDNVSEGASIEIFHGAHGKYETNSPVRTFATIDIDGEEHLLAAYTCTPLVTIPVKDLQDGKKVRGTTVAELGNRNKPLDMVVYKKDGKDFVLLANSARGVMKVSTDNIQSTEPITSRVEDKAGLSYETLDYSGVEHLDRLDEDHAVLLQKAQDNSYKLVSITLP
jgi:hypothetical protein